MRFRYVFMGVGSFLVLVLLFLTDPDTVKYNLPFGASTIAYLILLARFVILITMMHCGRRALSDYIDVSEVYNKAKQTCEGAGMVFIGVSIMMLSISLLILAVSLG